MKRLCFISEELPLFILVPLNGPLGAANAKRIDCKVRARIYQSNEASQEKYRLPFLDGGGGSIEGRHGVFRGACSGGPECKVIIPITGRTPTSNPPKSVLRGFAMAKFCDTVPVACCHALCIAKYEV